MQTDALETLKSVLYLIHPLPTAEMDALTAIWQPFHAKRKTMLTVAGETEKHLYFVLEGIQRVFYYDDDNREATIVFTYPPSFAGVADSFLTQQPSRFFAETLTNSTFLKTSFTDLNKLMQQSHHIEHLIRLSTNAAFSGVLQRMIEVQCYSAEDRFRALMKRSPHLLNLVPHKHIANYLGMDATNFSKLLGKVRL